MAGFSWSVNLQRHINADGIYSGNFFQDSESHVAIGYFAEVKYKQLNYVVSICGLLALICCAGMKVEKKNKVLGHLSIKNQKKENKIADLGWT